VKFSNLSLGLKYAALGEDNHPSAGLPVELCDQRAGLSRLSLAKKGSACAPSISGT
jgi:hypothetical protein